MDPRIRKLTEDLLRATAPSETPDDNYRPTHWCDRMYYLFKQTTLPDPARFAAGINWNTSPRTLASQLTDSLARWGGDVIESLEKIVAQTLRERQL